MNKELKEIQKDFEQKYWFFAVGVPAVIAAGILFSEFMIWASPILWEWLIK